MIAALVLSFSLLMARVGSFVAALPLFGGATVPRIIRVGLAFALAVLWFEPIFNRILATELLDQPAPTPWLGYTIALGREAVLGALMGYAFGLFLVPVRIAGEYITQEMGLTFGNLISPTGGNPTGPLTQIFEIFAIFVFLGLDGHHLFLAVLDQTFVRYPLGGTWFPQVPTPHIVAGAALAEEWGLLLAAPVGLVLFLTSVILALLMRAAPQLNLYTVGFPLRLGMGIGALLVLLPNLVAGLISLFGRFSQLLLWLV